MTRSFHWLLLFQLLVGLAAQAPPQSPPLWDGAVEATVAGLSGQTVYFFVKTPFAHSAQNIVVENLSPWPARLSAPTVTNRSYLQQGQRLRRFLYQFQAGTSGVFEVGPFQLSQDSETFLTDKITIVIKRRDEQTRPLPLLFNWTPLPQSVYLGESLLVGSHLNFATEISTVEWLQMPRFTNAIFEQVDVGGIQAHPPIDGQISYQVPTASWVLTPTKTGLVELQPGQVVYQGLRRQLSLQTITVLPLPPWLEKSGAIGDFSFQAQLEAAEILPGSSAVLTLQVKGRGNLHYLNMPSPESSSLNLVKSSERLDAVVDTNGYRGSKTIVYRLEQAEVGQYLIRIPSFRWLTTDGERGEQRTPPLTLKVSKTFKPNFGNALLENKQLSVLKLQGFWLRVGWLFLLFPALLLPLFAFIKRRGRLNRWWVVSVLGVWLLGTSGIYYSESQLRNQATLQRAQTFFDQGNYREALALYHNLVLNYGDSAGYRINHAIILYRLNAYVQSLEQLYASQRLLVSNLILKDGFKAVREKMPLVGDRSRLPVYQQFYLTIATMALVWLLAGLLTFYLSAQRSLSVFPLTVTLAMLIVAVALLFWPRSSYAILARDNVRAYRIPAITAEHYQSLTQGQLARIVYYQNNYYFIETLHGFSGWVPQDTLISLTND